MFTLYFLNCALGVYSSLNGSSWSLLAPNLFKPKLTEPLALKSPEKTLPVYELSIVNTDNFLELEINLISSI